MARVTIEDCLKRVNNRFMLVHLGAKRVIQLRKGAKLLVDAPKNKEVVLALREIAAGAVSFDSIAQMELEQLVVRSEDELSEAPDASTQEQDEREFAPEPAAEVQTGDEPKSQTQIEEDED